MRLSIQRCRAMAWPIVETHPVRCRSSEPDSASYSCWSFLQEIKANRLVVKFPMLYKISIPGRGLHEFRFSQVLMYAIAITSAFSSSASSDEVTIPWGVDREIQVCLPSPLKPRGPERRSAPVTKFVRGTSPPAWSWRHPHSLACA